LEKRRSDPDIEFNPELFNPNFWHLREAMTDEQIRFIWLVGGSSSGKTYETVQAILYDALENGTDTLVFRKTDASIEKTVYKDFCTVIDNWDAIDEFKILKSPKQIRCCSGAVIDFAGMDDPEKIKGISQYKRVYCNEVSAFDHADFKQIRKRLRGQAGQQFIGDLNPIDETHWIKVDVFDNMEHNPRPTTLNNGIVEPEFTQITDKWMNSPAEIINPKGEREIIPPNTVVLKSTYLNNFWVVGSPCGTFGFYDLQTIADFESDKATDYNFYKIYALGDWGRLTKGGEFYKAFDPSIHVVPKIDYNPDLPLHISFDENVNPYVSLSVYQAQGDKAWKIDEICLRNPKNTLAYTLKEFRIKYPVNKSGLMIYGDRTSLKADTKLEHGQNFYTIALSALNDYNPSLRLPSKNPPVAMRGNFINEVILKKYMYTISDVCKNTITDYLYVKEHSDGTKLKEKAKDSVTKVSYEKYGHLTDTDDYFFCQYFAKEFSQYQRGGRKSGIITG